MQGRRISVNKTDSGCDNCPDALNFLIFVCYTPIMQIAPARFPQDLPSLKSVAERAFSSGPDSSLEEWFSFDEMEKILKQDRGVCLKASSETNEIVGMIFVAQESPINGKESEEKWVINIIGVNPEKSGHGIGAALLKEAENEARKRGIKKMFVFTNKGDDKVIHFYQQNGYKDAGWIRDYQYGKGNSAVFLLKYL